MSYQYECPEPDFAEPAGTPATVEIPHKVEGANLRLGNVVVGRLVPKEVPVDELLPGTKILNPKLKI